MRNLKRVLSLALATVMLLGMMVIGAGAADAKKPLTDLDKVTNKEAVTLLVDLGLIGGKPDGSYAPAEIVDRATMAKLITYIMMGDVDQNSFKGATTDLTDITGNWAEGYIKFCYSNKIISGNGMGKFNPSEPVTTAAAAKMLLVALGYVASDRGYEGASWSLNVMRDAQSTTETIGSTTVTRSLTKGTSVKANDPLTRDNAAQMIFNTLFVKTQEPIYQWDGGKQYIQKYDSKSSMAATTYNGLVRVADVLKSVDAANKTAAIGSDATVKVLAKTGDIGGTVAYYKDGAGKLISTAAVASASNVLAASTNGTSFVNLTTKGKTGYIGSEIADTGATVYENGTAKNSGTAYANLGALQSAMSTTHDKIGTTIEFIDTKSVGKYDVIKVTNYTLSTVSKTTEAKADGTEAAITIKGVSGTVKQSLVSGDFANLAKDDVILYAKIGDMYYVYEPTTATGKMTKYNTIKHTMEVDGTAYSAANVKNDTSMTSAQSFAGKGESKFYIDKNGYVVAVDGIASETKYVALDAIAFVPGTGTETKGYAEARLILPDGTKQTVKVSKLADNAVVGKTDTTVGDYATYIVNSDTTKNTELTNCIYTYKVDSNEKYELTRVSEDSSVTVLKGVATIGSVATANNDTVYVYKTTSGTSTVLTAYTGYKNAPSTTAAANVAVATKGGYAAFVYVDATGTTVGDATTNVVVFLDNMGIDNSGADPVYLYSASIDGKVDTYKAKSPLTYTANTLYEVTVDAKGYITSKAGDYDFTNEAITSYAYANATADAKGGTVKTNTTINTVDNATLTFDGSETVYLIGGKTVVSGTAADIKTGTFFWVKTVDTTTNAGKIAMKIVYVLTPDDAKASAAPATATVSTSSGTVTLSGNKDLVAAAVTATATTAGAKLTVTAAAVTNGYVTVTIDGAGIDVTATGLNATVAAADYITVLGDINQNLTITVTSAQAGMATVSNTYTIAVS